MLIFLVWFGVLGGGGFGREGCLCDMIDWDFGFLGFFLSVMRNVSVARLAGCVCSLAWPGL